MNNECTVCLMGDFVISYKGKTLSVSDLHSRKLKLLLAYLLYNYHRKVTMQELMDTIWDEESDIKNPEGALKNLIYRLRKSMKAVWEDTNFWITYETYYLWNPDIKLDVDVKKIDQLISKETNSGNWRKVLDEWISLYKGNFLADCNGIYWIEYTRLYYKSQYFTAIKYMFEKMNEEKDYNLMEKIAKHGVEVDSLEEQSHYWFMYACLSTHKYAQLSSAYEKVIKNIYEGNENYASYRIKKIGQMIHHEKMKDNIDIDSVILELNKMNKNTLCSLETFEKIYQIERQNIKNESDCFSVILLNCKYNDSSDKQENISYEIEDNIQKTINYNDIFSKYNDNQFLLLLRKCNKTKAGSMMMHLFKELQYNKKIQTTYEVKEINISTLDY